MTKRIADVEENTPVADAARRVLAVRLEAVRDRIGDTLADARNRRRHIHALRVATRRAAAAADLFATCLPKKVYRQLRDHLRALRRTVGTARDWDVVLSQLGQRAGDRHADRVCPGSPGAGTKKARKSDQRLSVRL